MRYKINFIVIISLFFSCDSSLRIEKRRYMKGYYSDFTRLHKKNNPTVFIQDKETAIINCGHNEDSLLFVKKGDLVSFVINKNNTVSKKSFNKSITFIPINAHLSDLKKDKSNSKSILTQKNIKKLSDKKSGWYLLLFIAGLLSLSYWGVTNRNAIKANKLRNWAFKNKYKFLAIIFVSKVFIAISSFWLGVKLFEFDYLLPSFFIPTLGTSYFTIWLATIFQKKSNESFFSLFKNKFKHLFISMIGMLLCISLGNKVANENSNNLNTSHHINKRCANYFESKTEKFSANNSAIDSTSKAKDGSSLALKGVLMFFVIFSIIVLQLAAIIGGCILACNGSEGYAALLIVGGTVLLVALSILTIYWITRIDLEKNKETPQTN